ncbi:MAG: YfiR family protein [Gammaproteobacteria bacterium]|nr:YfiR family protein [Gammaproteobacteria bacterium]
MNRFKIFFSFPPNMILGLMLLLLGGSAHAEETYYNEYEVKMVFLYKLALLVEWPDERKPDIPITFCFYGEDIYGSPSKLVEDKTIRHHSISVKKEIGLNRLNECQLLFVRASEQKQLADILSLLKERPVLTVGETKTFARHGGIISLIKQKDASIGIELNVEAAKQAGLVIDPRLLSFATMIDDK